jgi:D-aminopeptidase
MGDRSLREHGLRIGELDAGPRNSISDVAGIGVGHVTVRRDEPEPPEGRGVARTGVTAIAPGAPLPLAAGMAVLNGAGELTSALEISEWGLLQTPVYLTATMAVGRVYDGAVTAAVAADTTLGLGVDDVVIPVVGECDDSWLSEARVVQVEAEDAGRALADARPDFAQGAVGAGTGMVCFDWKGGIGSASRLAAGGGPVVGVLVLANYGAWSQLRVDGVPVGRLLGDPDAGPTHPAGSCIAVVATDAALDSAQLTRLAARAGLGLARTGSVAHHGSGEIFLAFATGTSAAVSDRDLDPLFAAAVDATEEAVLNALWSAGTVEGRDGRVVRALPHDDVLELLVAHRTIER